MGFPSFIFIYCVNGYADASMSIIRRASGQSLFGRHASGMFRKCSRMSNEKRPFSIVFFAILGYSIL